MSRVGGRVNEHVKLPGKDIAEYIDIHDEELKKNYHGKNKIPMQIFHDAYFDGKIDFKGETLFTHSQQYLSFELKLTRHLPGDVLEIMELRHDWAHFHFTPELFKYVLFNLIPEVVVHSAAQDEEQVRDHYDRGDDFYNWWAYFTVHLNRALISLLDIQVPRPSHDLHLRHRQGSRARGIS